MSLIVSFLSTKITPGVDATTALGDSTHKFTDLWLSATIQFPSSGSIVIDTSTGLKIGTGTTQKIGFFNATPIVQPANSVSLETVLSNLGLRASGTTAPLTVGALTTDTIVSNTSVRSPIFYFGDSTVDGTWRFRINSGNLVIELRVAGNWVEKGKFEA